MPVGMEPLIVRPLRLLVMKSGRALSPTMMLMLAGAEATAWMSTGRITVFWLLAASAARTRKVVCPLPSWA